LKVTTRYFGDIEVEESKILLFPWGIPGFEHLHRFLLLEDRGFFWLQSVDDPDIVFAVCDPFVCFPGYEVEIPSPECEALGITKSDEVIVLAIMSVRSPQEIGVNLLAPLVINCTLKMGKQIILEDERYTLYHPLVLKGQGAEVNAGHHPEGQ